MNQNQNRRYDALARARDYILANTGDVGPAAESSAFRELDQAIVAIDASADVQGTIQRDRTGQGRDERSLDAALRNEHMKPIAIFARARLRGAPGIASLSTLGGDLHGRRLVRAARAMASSAAPFSRDLAAGSMPADTVEQLVSAAGALELAVEARGNARVNRVKATKEVSRQLDIGRDALNILHALVSKQCANNPSLLAGWDSARRVGEKIGAVRRSTGTTPAVDVAA